jgi:ribosomal protein L29
MAIKKIIKTAKKVDEAMTVDQLRVELSKTKNDLIDAKRGHRLGELTNPRAITVMRKKIARFQTAIRADEIASSLTSEKGDK